MPFAASDKRDLRVYAPRAHGSGTAGTLRGECPAGVPCGTQCARPFAYRTAAIAATSDPYRVGKGRGHIFSQKAFFA